mgnify:CR=1 FL=1
MTTTPPDTEPHLLAGLLDAYKEPAVLLDERYRIVAANAAYRALYGWDGTVTRSRTGRRCPAI